MSKQPSVIITRKVPGVKALVQHYKKEQDGDRVRRLNAMILMHKLGNAERVAELLEASPDTVRRWVEAFNADGLAGLYKKKVPAGRPS